MNALSHLRFWITVLAAAASLSSPAWAEMRVVTLQDKDGNQIGLYKESHALIVGVSDYTAGWPDLPGVLKDVEQVKAALEDQGFNVEVVQDPNHDQLEEAFTAFISKHGHGVDNRLLFYFAGHGHTMKLAYGGDMGYIVPTDAPNPNKDRKGFMAKALDMERIEVFAKKIESKHALFLFDSCFSGSIFALSRAVPENISYKTSKPVRQFITAGSANETVPDESIFRDQFIAALNGEADSDQDGYLTGVELGEFLQAKVVNYSHGSQHPQYGKLRNPLLDKGDFVFAVAPSTPPEESLDDDLASLDDKEKKRLEAEIQRLKNEKNQLEQENLELKDDLSQSEQEDKLRETEQELQADIDKLARLDRSKNSLKYRMDHVYSPKEKEAMRRAHLSFHRKNYQVTVKIAKALSRRGNPDAQALLGQLYFRGLGVKKNNMESYKWLGVAARKIEVNGTLLIRVHNSLKPKQIFEADRWIKNWKPKK